MAASSTWDGASTTDGNWTDGANWVSGFAPGVDDGTVVNTDIATFNTAVTGTAFGTAVNPIFIDQINQNIGGITFTGGVGSYTIGSAVGSNSLFMTSGANITLSSFTAAQTETINAPLVMEGTGMTINNTTGATGNIIITGSISGGAAGAENLALMGVSAGGANTLSGGIDNGLGTVSVTGTGSKWILSGSNAYTGTTLVITGTMIFSGTSGSPTQRLGAITDNGASGSALAAQLQFPAGATYTTAINQSQGSTNGVQTILFNGGAVDISGNISLNNGSGSGTGLTTMTAGTVNAGGITIGRDLASTTSVATTLKTTDGLLVQGGTLTVTGANGIAVGSTSNSTALLNITGGTVSITTGSAQIGSSASSNKYSVLGISGGNFNVNTNIVLAGVTDTAGTLEDEFLMLGGTTTAQGIFFAGNYSTLASNSAAELLGGVLVLGSGGITSGTGHSTSTLAIGGATTAPTIYASAPWTSTVSIALGATAPTFVTSGTDNTPETITINGGISGSTALNITGPGQMIIGTSIASTGPINIGAGTTLTVSGAADLGASGQFAGALSNSGSFNYTSSSNTTFNGVVSGTGAFINNGTGNLLFGNSYSGTGPLAINSGGIGITGTGQFGPGGVYSTNLVNNGTFVDSASVPQTLSGQVSGSGGIKESGQSQLTIAGVNSYTGATTVSSGTLSLVSGAALGDTAINVTGGTLLASPGAGTVQIGTSNASLSLGSNTLFSMQDGAIGTVVINGNAAGTGLTLLGSGTTSNGLAFDVGSTGADLLSVPTGAFSFSTSTNPDNIMLDALSTAAPTSLSNIPILSIPSGGLSLADFNLETTSLSFNSNVYAVSLSVGGTGGSSQLLLTLTPTGTANFYFTGLHDSSWSTLGNFASTNSGVAAQPAVPTASSNVFLVADNATTHGSNYLTETIDGVTSVNSLSFTGTDSNGSTAAVSHGITLNSGTATAPLIITAVSAFTDANGKAYAAGRGLVVQANSASHIINANINLGNSQRWEIDNSPSNPLTMNGIIGDGSTADALLKTGSGTLILNGANTYDGGTTISNGLVQMGPLGTLSSVGALTVTSGTSGTTLATFDLAGTTQTVGGLSDGGFSTGTVTSTTSGSASLTVLTSAITTFSGTISDSFASNGGTLALTFSGSGNVTLSGSNTFTGGATLSAGSVSETTPVTSNLTVANNYALGNPTSANPNAGLNFNTVNSGDIVNAFFTSASPNLASLNAAGPGTANIILGNATSGSATTLSFGAGGSSQVSQDQLTETISDQSAVKAGAIGNLTIYGGAFVQIYGANTFTGVTTLIGSPTELQIENSFALQDSILDYNNQGGVLNVPSSFTAITLGGIEGTEDFSTTNDGSLAIAVSIGNATSTYNGNFQGIGGLIKIGSGTFTLSGTSYATNGLIAGNNSSSTGSFTINGQLGASGTDNVPILNDGGLITINGTVFASSLQNDSGFTSGSGPNSTTIINSGANVTIAGVLAADANNADQNGLIAIDGGTVTANSVTVGRGNVIVTAPGIIGTTTEGLYINGGTLNDLGNLTVGGNTASTANMRIDSGALNVAGTAIIDNAAGTRLTHLDVYGGIVTVSDTSGIGIRLGGLADALAEDSELLVDGGTVNTPEITMGAPAQTTGTNYLIAAAGILNIGAGGIINGNPTNTTEIIDFGFGVGGTLTIGALGSWSTLLPITLGNAAGGTTPSFIMGSGITIALNGSLTGLGGLTVGGAGTLVLGNANSYTGFTNINAGTLLLGNANAISATSQGIEFGGGTLEYSSTNALDYSSQIVNSTAPIALNTNGQAVTFASAIATSNTGGLSVTDSAGGGSLTLTKASTYAAPTSVGSGATLTLTSGASLGQTAISVATGGTLKVLTGVGTNTQFGTTAASLTLAAGASLNLTGSGIGTLTINSTGSGTGTVLTFGGTTASPDVLSFGLGGAGASEIIANNGIISFAGSPQNNIILSALLGSSPSSLSQIPLILDSNGTFVLSDFHLNTSSISVGGNVYNVSLGVLNNDELYANLVQVASAGYFFTGAQSASWNNIQNFATDHTGTVVQSGTLGSTDNISLVADNASGGNYKNETIDGNLTINSLTFTGTNSTVGNTPAATSGITLSSGTATAPLTILAAAAFGDVNNNGYLNTGVVVQVGSASHTLATNINLGNSQTWEIDNSPSNPLIVTGTIGDGSTLDVLTKAGAGTLLLETAEAYDGGTTINGGTLQLGISNALLTTPTVTVSGSGTLDLDGNSQTLTNLADGGVSTGVITSSTGASTLTISNTNTITYRGGIQDNFFSNGSSLSLVLAGTSAITLSGSSNYSGSTTLDGGLLTAAGNHALGSGSSANAGLVFNPILTGSAQANFTSASPTVGYIETSSTGVSTIILGNGTAGTATTLNITGGGSNVNMVYNGTIGDSIALNAAAIGSINLSGGTLTLNGSDTYTGTTSVNGSGTLIFGNSSALQDSTLVTSGSTGGTISFGTLASVTLGGLAGSGALAPNIPVTFGGNNSSQTYSGALSGTGSFIKAGTGAETLSGVNTYSGSTTLAAGTLNITNTLGTSGSATGAITSATGTININNNALVTASSLSQYGGAFVVISGTSTVNVLGNLGANANNANTPGLTSITAGATVNATTVTVGRDSVNLGTGLQTGGASTTDGLYVNGGNLNISSTLAVGGNSATTNSSAIMRLDSGTVTVNGPAQVTGYTDKRINILDIAGGTFTDNDTSGAGMVVGGNAPGASGTSMEFTELSIRGGVVNTPEITVSGTAQTDGLSSLFIDGGTVNIGANGILEPGGSSFAAITLGLATATTSPTLTATASWSSSAPMVLANNTTAVSPTFQTSPAVAAAANTITLTGVLSGSGGITESGSGTLILAAGDTFLGATTVSGSAGRLVVSGSLTASSSATVAVGGHLEVDGSFNNAGAINDNGFLNGNGVVGVVNVNAGGTLGPGHTLGLTAPGNLTANGNVTFSGATSSFSIRLGVLSPTDSDQLTVGNSGTVNLAGTTLKLTLGSAFQTPTVGFIYVLINGGAGATGSGTDVFSGLPSSGGTYVDSAGDEFNVYYAVSPTNVNTVGSDVDLLYVGPVPEPSTWAELLAGAAVLVVWRRRSRRAHA